MAIKPVILCGGSGTRLWPLSTKASPKQFLALTDKETMISLTSSRLKTPTPHDLDIAETLVVGSLRHADLLNEQLPGAEFILEPFGRNSAPAVAAAAVVCDPDDLLLILPADHHITKPVAFLNAINTAIPAAEAGAIVTFGIQPDHPAVGYGYIKASGSEPSIKPVESFVEKPKKEIAEQYLADGNYFWNAGIFFFKASTMLAAFETHAPKVLADVKRALSARQGKTFHLDPELFAQAEDISIDYAIMEPATNIQVVPVEMGWSDVGDYQALWEMSSESAGANVTLGPVVVDQSEGLFVRTEGPTIAVSGLKDCVIVATKDTVMISPRGEAAVVKTLGAAAQAKPTCLAISKDTSSRAKDLLWSALKTWVDLAWDPAQGGFVESLDMSGTPDAQADRRVRVQARQTYSFARAILLSKTEPTADAAFVAKATTLVRQGLDYMDTKCRHPEGGWVHRLNGAGEVIDATRDLYDHAFIMMSCAAAYQALGDVRALKLAEEVIDFIDANLADTQNGGYFESLPMAAPRRANPHMHLLEAFLGMHEATQDKAYLDRASDMVTLFEARLFDPRLNILREFFSADWSPASGEAGHLFEPGHHYEWATLLAMHAERSGHDSTSWRRRLIQQADKFGREAASGLAHNSALPDGTPLNANRRNWPQLEMFRARLYHPGTASPGDADRVFDAIMATYFDGMPAGTWLDETDANGEGTSTAIPGSILYHLVTALTPAFE